jgi:hypothetical protein
VKHTLRSKACSVPTFPSHLPRPLPSNPFAFPVPRAIYIFFVTTIGTCSKVIVRIASTYLSLLFENTLSMPFLLMWHASTRFDAYHAGTLTQNSVCGPALHHCMSDPHVRAMFKLKHLHVPCLQVWPPPHLLWLEHTRD